jgi:hypothetical protein
MGYSDRWPGSRSWGRGMVGSISGKTGGIQAILRQFASIFLFGRRLKTKSREPVPTHETKWQKSEEIWMDSWHLIVRVAGQGLFLFRSGSQSQPVPANVVSSDLSPTQPFALNAPLTPWSRLCFVSRLEFVAHCLRASGSVSGRCCCEPRPPPDAWDKDSSSDAALLGCTSSGFASNQVNAPRLKR